MPAHHKAEEYVDAYMEAAGVQRADKHLPLFRSINSERKLTTRRIDKREVWEMIKRRARAAGLPPSICCHTFRAYRNHIVSGEWRDHREGAADRGL